MGSKSSIEWTNASWSPIRARNLKTGKIGWHCEHATTGCEFCYAEAMNKRLGTGLPFKPGHRGDIEIFLDEEMLLAPLRWRKPRMIFVCSMTDLFADFVPVEFIDKIFAVMALAGRHTFQVLTKRSTRMLAHLASYNTPSRIADEMDGNDSIMPAMANHVYYEKFFDNGWTKVKLPLENVWLGVSCERQQEADERIPYLLNTPAAIRFVSLEPLLGPINLESGSEVTEVGYINWLTGFDGSDPVIPGLDWVIVGGESGPQARPMYPRWVSSIKDQCRATGVPFFFKQWGGPNKKAAGRLLDGVEHNGFPVIEGVAHKHATTSPDPSHPVVS